MLKKGVVISPPFRPLPNGISIGGEVDPFIIRKYLTYWDEIDYPSNELAYVSSPDIDYLEQVGIVKRSHIEGWPQQCKDLNGVIKNEALMFIYAQESAFRENENKEPGSWSIAQLSNLPYYTEQKKDLAIDFELYGMLPVPSTDTPLADILEFKQRHEDQLIEFRIHLDEIYQKIICSLDIPRAKNTEIAKLQTALLNLDKVMKESLMKCTATNLRTIINADFSGIVGATLSAAGISSLINMTPLVAGAAGAGLVITYKVLTTPTGLGYPSPLNYINSVKSTFQTDR